MKKNRNILLLVLIGLLSAMNLHATDVILNFFVGSTKIHHVTVTAGTEYTLSTLRKVKGEKISIRTQGAE
ncbi:MAG: hypothetical protein J5884_06710 [Paludibacteraceae bacterium]|nr:hypothetical protein [Paludibacteraceae bacterium]